MLRVEGEAGWVMPVGRHNILECAAVQQKAKSGRTGGEPVHMGLPVPVSCCLPCLFERAQRVCAPESRIRLQVYNGMRRSPEWQVLSPPSR